MYNEEIWVNSLSYPDILVSSYGRIKLPEKYGTMPNGGIRYYSTKPTFGYKFKAHKNASHIYMGLYSRKYGSIKVHRLVCEAFHGLPTTTDLVVIHLDENSTNNHYLNLKWGTQKENLNMPKFIEYCKTRVGDNSPMRKHRKNFNV